MPNKATMKIPLGVQIIAILDFLAAGLLVLLSLIFFFGGALIKAILEKNAVTPSFGSGTVYVLYLIFIGFLLIGIAILNICIGVALWRGRNWARILTIVISGILIIIRLFDVFNGKFSSIISIAICLLIVGYLATNRDVKSFFKN